VKRRCIGYKMLSGGERKCGKRFICRAEGQRRCARCEKAHRSAMWSKKVSEREALEFARTSEPESVAEVAHALAIRMLAGRE
jgi:hypothetical protein